MDHGNAVDALAALAQTHRLSIFRRLVREGPEGLPASEIAEALGIRATSLSFHIKELERAGLVSATRQGRSIRYAIHIDGIRHLFGFLVDECCGGRPELCGASLCEIDTVQQNAPEKNGERRGRLSS